MNKFIITTLVVSAAAAGALYGPVTAQNDHGDTITHTSPVQSLTVASDAVLSPVVRDGFTTKSVPVTLPACAEEDSHDCIWDAQTTGNGSGVSFIDYHGHVYYLDPQYDY